jgi:hypothetical protein
MSRLAETRSAYDKLVELLDAEVRKRSGSTKDLERFQETLDVAFYLLGWVGTLMAPSAAASYQPRKRPGVQDSA